MSTLVLVVLSVVLLPTMIWGDKNQAQKSRIKGKKESPLEAAAAAAVAKKKAQRKDNSKLEDELWVPHIEYKSWQEANQIPGCPWSFDGCDCVEEVIRRIWRNPLHTGLQQALEALVARVSHVRIARVQYYVPEEEEFFTVVYSLKTGAELFGGQPLEMSVGLDLMDTTDIEESGLRQRHGSGAPKKKIFDDDALELDNGLPCLAPFYRIHDGFGCMISTKHLPVLLAAPSDSMQGSCFYIYPSRCLVPLKTHPYLVKFARVDKDCAACADIRDEHPHVLYAESNGNLTQDDEAPMDFVADTICNVAGQKVVPDGATYHAFSGNMPKF